MKTHILRNMLRGTVGLLLVALMACSNAPQATHAPHENNDYRPGAHAPHAPYPTPPAAQAPQYQTPYPTGPHQSQYPQPGYQQQPPNYPQIAMQPPMPGQPGAASMQGPPTLGAPQMDPIQEAMTFEALHTDEQYLEPGSLYSLSVRNADVRDVLLALGRQSPFNFVVSPYVEGAVTLDMHDVPLQNLMDAIVNPLDLTYRIDGDIIWVQPLDTSSEFFTLNYIITRRTSTRTVTGNTIAGSSDFGSNGSNNGVDTVSSTERTAIFENIRASIAMLMSPDGQVEINEESGLVSVIDYKQNLMRIEQFLQRVSESLNRQVMIQAKLVEVTYSRGDQFGIDWAAVAGDMSLSIAGNTTGQVLQGVLNTDDVDMVVRAIAERQNVAIRNSPNVSSLNNQAAIIVLGEQEVIFETIEDLDEVTGQVIRRRTTPRSITVGVSLHVMPQIASNGKITLNIHNRVTEKVGEAVGPDGTRVPELSVREVDTIAHMRQGQTMVLAGMTTEREIEARSGVPILSDIPLIGGLATTRRDEKRKTELVLFITPTLVHP
jgi:type II secretory pathway component GspD/PulD (secretin)